MHYYVGEQHRFQNSESCLHNRAITWTIVILIIIIIIIIVGVKGVIVRIAFVALAPKPSTKVMLTTPLAMCIAIVTWINKNPASWQSHACIKVVENLTINCYSMITKKCQLQNVKQLLVGILIYLKNLPTF